LNKGDIWLIVTEKRNDDDKAIRSEQRWGTDGQIQMAIIQQESSFRINARPPRTKLMGLIPWARQSNAYGYAQALDGTWVRYKAFPSGIPTINISPITKDRLAARILQLKELAQKIGEACRAPGKKLVGAVAKLQGSAG